jgi:hypothetical protein
MKTFLALLSVFLALPVDANDKATAKAQAAWAWVVESEKVKPQEKPEPEPQSSPGQTGAIAASIPVPALAPGMHSHQFVQMPAGTTTIQQYQPVFRRSVFRRGGG